MAVEGFFKSTPAEERKVLTHNFIRRSPESLTYRTYKFPPAGRKYQDITGAKEPVLPMKIAIPDKNGFRLEFVMLINPNTVNQSKTHDFTSNYTRNGYTNQLWGPNLGTMSSTGRTAAFITSDTGLTARYRTSSIGYLNFMALFNAYKNNGYRLLDITQQGILSKITRVIQVVSGVELFYDGEQYMGHFNNFTLDESADAPFLFNYNFEVVLSTLSGDYSEIRGHFVRLPEGTEEPDDMRSLSSLNSYSVSNQSASETPMSSPEDTIKYTVQEGDTLQSIGGNNWKNVAEYNNVDSVQSGQVIEIPKYLILNSKSTGRQRVNL